MVKSYSKKFFICIILFFLFCSMTLIFAACSPEQILYTITFETGTDNLEIEPIVAKAGDEIAIPKIERDGFIFYGWEGNDNIFKSNTMPNENITLVAKWLEKTNLPLMSIDLSDEEGNKVNLENVVKEKYVKSSISLTNTDSNYQFSELDASFKGRGNGTWYQKKKGYKIKFDKKQSLFGLEANKHWVIIPCFDDETMSRNYMAYNMAREVFSGIEYTTTAQWIDIFVNGEYQGVYLLCEHVRVGKGRVDIESEYGVDDTGYLLEYDSYYSGEENVDYFLADGLDIKYGFTIHSPDPEDNAYETDGGISKERFKQQILYIKDYVTRVYKAALEKDWETFCELADLDSFLDMYLLHEYCKNTDTGYSSFYLYKKPGGKLYAGPAWDFDLSANVARGENGKVEGIYVADGVSNTVITYSELYASLYRTDEFRAAINVRWKELSPKIRAFIDEKLNEQVYEENRIAMARNYVKWNGRNLYDAEKNWLKEIEILKNWYIGRLEWLDNEWK